MLVLGLINLNKYLKFDKKLIKYILIEILSTILLFHVLIYHFN